MDNKKLEKEQQNMHGTKNKKAAIPIILGIMLLLIVYLLMLFRQRAVVLRYNEKFWTFDVVLLTLIFILSLLFILILGIKLYKKSTDYDLLTEIHNADWIMHEIGYLNHRKMLKGYVCVFSNIEDFKYINKKFGNAKGDRILKDYANAINGYIDGKGFVGRLGGDNFLIAIKGEHVDQFFDFSRNIYVEVENDGEEETLKINLRGGVSPFVEGTDFKEIISRASMALSIAKSKKLDFVWFEDYMIRQMVKTKEITLACKEAFNNKEFIAYYQPKVDALTNKLCGAEALARWKHNGKIILPGEFVSALEENGSIVKLDFYMLETVCLDIKKWLAEGLEPVRVSVNFSKLNLKNENFAEKIFETVRKYGVDPKYIEIELTESSCEEDYDRLKKFINHVKGYGFVVSIDDFGTGYSSLSMLRGLNVDTIKLDRSFLTSAYEEDFSSKLFIQDIIRMINNQNEKILCEGVETKDILDFLKESGCHVIQGFYFDKPLDIITFEKRLQNPQY